MKKRHFLTLLPFAPCALCEVPDAKLGELQAKIGATFWGEPKATLVRATAYPKGKGAGDSNSAKGKSDEKISLRYASDKEAGTCAVPSWLPRGSMVKIHTTQGVLSYVAADEGGAVEKSTAAKAEGKTNEEKAAQVLDFCALKQLWPDFILVEVYYYAGKVPFGDLTREEQETLFRYAMTYVKKQE